eukprot:CAMPEP_0178397526 /NCGR_PEP_ID=MMETSP0689_2-20121128/14293_1 /TAXON_ID=160604 /ORGANISM="Amphidinium massartii, Strain CS-259" /LENGTH=262 /DNA_ID=CAMNT_0020018241 /DNA_START=136 /DNA_END=921 /DNA_ORIENTATION=-
MSDKAVSKSEVGKLVYFVRHGQGEHNVGMESQDLSAEEAFLELACKHHDARLTALGVRQAEAVGQLFSGGMLPPPEVVITSTQTRALATAVGAFGHLGVPMVASDTWRERCGVWLCEHRRSCFTLRKEFPQVDFSQVACDVDALWTPSRESRLDVEKRAEAAMQEVLSRPEQVLAVVSHSVFLASYALSRRNGLLHFVSDELEKPFSNAELREAVLAEVQDGNARRITLRWQATVPNGAPVDKREAQSYEKFGRQNMQRLND